MSKMRDSDAFGGRMKSYEAIETDRRLNPYLPIYARIDGRSFSTFTRGMKRPFDIDMTNAMIATTTYLVAKTNALMGYTQSDEISLVWKSEAPPSDVMFSGKVQKLTSVLASMAASKFMTVIPEKYRERLPHFDARVFQLPSEEEAANAFLWRAMDARKNAISMVAQNRFSPKELHGKTQVDMLAMLSGAGVDFESFPAAFKRGSFIRTIAVERLLSEEEMGRIPERNRPKGPVIRHVTEVIDMPPFNLVDNRSDVIFRKADAVKIAEKQENEAQ